MLKTSWFIYYLPIWHITFLIDQIPHVVHRRLSCILIHCHCAVDGLGVLCKAYQRIMWDVDWHAPAFCNVENVVLHWNALSFCISSLHTCKPQNNRLLWTSLPTQKEKKMNGPGDYEWLQGEGACFIDESSLPPTTCLWIKNCDKWPHETANVSVKLTHRV